mmetsp:Transcript_16484/g.37868  ORF Transcript_16484/g.37868 Transcript_16484/m.37868 type:complete len:312 (+) Transcript_16484:478-1413(+)
MKQNATNTHLHIGEGQNITSVEWSPTCFITKEKSSTLEIHSPPLLSPRARGVSSDSVSGSTSGSVSSSSSSSSFGFAYYDEPDDINSDKSVNEEDDPIISFETLSLETRRIGVSPRVVALGKEGKKKLIHQGTNLGASSRMQPSPLEQLQESPSKSLRIGTLFEKNDKPSRNPVKDRELIPSVLLRKRMQQQGSWKLNELVRTDAMRNEALVQPVQEHRRSPCGKKYTLRKQSQTAYKNSGFLLSVSEFPKSVRHKRQRGGSDFSILNEGGATSSSSPTDRRKRRRMNRNRAMAADEFDSILSQINHSGSY